MTAYLQIFVCGNKELIYYPTVSFALNMKLWTTLFVVVNDLQQFSIMYFNVMTKV